MAGPGGVEVGRVSVKVVPDVDGFREKVKRELEEVDKMGADVEVSIDMAKFKAQIEEIKVLLKSISDESVNVKIDVDKGGIGGGGLVDLEKQFSSARKEAEKFKEKLSGIGDGEDEKQVSKFSRLVENLGKFFGQAADSASNLASTLSTGLSAGVDKIGTSLFSLITTLITWVPLLAAAAGGITFIIGFLAAGLGALPGILFGLGAPIAAVILGFDGIKKAAGQLSPAIDAIKKRLSDTFTKELTPVFKELGKIMPVISDGLNLAAQGASRFVKAIVGVVTSSSNVENLKKIFQGVGVFIDKVTDGVSDFIDTLLRVGGATSALEDVGGIIQDLFFAVSSFFAENLSNGELVKGIRNFRTILQDVLKLFTDLLTNSLKFFNGATPGADKFFTSMDKFFNRIDWEKLGKAFGDALAKVGDGLDNLPQGTIEKFTTAFSDLATAIGDLLSGDSLNVLIALFGGVIEVVTFVVKAFDGLLSIVPKISEFFDSIPDKFSELGDAFGTLFDGIGTIISMRIDQIGEFFSSIPDKLIGAIQDSIDFLVPIGKGWIDGLGRGINDAFTAVGEFFTSLPGRILGLLGDLAGFLIGKGRDLIGGFGSGITVKWSDVVAFLQSIPSRVGSFFSGAGSWLVSVGGNIIQGLINGLNGKVGSLLARAADIARSVINIIGGAFRVGSPSRVMFEMGEFVMQGLENGMQKASKDVLNTASGISSDIIGSFDATSLRADMTVSGNDIAAVGTSQLNVAGNVTGVAGEVAAALAGWTVELDANGIARLVNKANNVKARRG